MPEPAVGLSGESRILCGDVAARLKPCPSRSVPAKIPVFLCRDFPVGVCAAPPFSMSGSEVAIDEMATVAVAFQPIIQKCLIEVGRDDLFAKFVSLGADEGQAQPCKHGDQRLGDAVRD